MRSRIVRGDARASEVGVAQLVVGAVDDSDPDAEVALEILHRPEAIGNESAAYIIFGIPGTESYSFLDLNALPDDLTATVTLQRDSGAPIVSRFRGKLGNHPLPAADTTPPVDPLAPEGAPADDLPLEAARPVDTPVEPISLAPPPPPEKPEKPAKPAKPEK